MTEPPVPCSIRIGAVALSVCQTPFALTSSISSHCSSGVSQSAP